MAASVLIAQNVLEHLLGLSTWTAPSGLYIALFTADPGTTGASGEVSGNGYTRVLAANWQEVGSTGVYENSADISFPVASGSWGTITHWGIFDAASSGNYLLGNALAASKDVDATNNRFKFETSDLTFGLGLA